MGFFVAGAEFDVSGPDTAVDPGRPFYTAGSLQWDAKQKDLYWQSDHSLVTDAVGIALMWALATVGMVDDGEHPKPLARVVAHKTDPAEIDYEGEGVVGGDEEKVVAFVTPMEIIYGSDPEGQALQSETFDLSEIIKTTG